MTQGRSDHRLNFRLVAGSIRVGECAQDIIRTDEVGLASKSVAPVYAERAYDNPLVSQSLQHGLEIACFRQIETRGNTFGRNPLVPRMDRDIRHDSNGQYLSTCKERQSGAPAGRQ